MPPITCPKCSAEQPRATDFCLTCGLPLRMRCPHCGATTEPNARRCARCGNRLGDPLSFAELFDVPASLQGRYEIEKRVKRGHATAVYLARDRGLNRQCIIKEFNPRRLSDDFERDEAQRSFHAEAAQWAQLRHPNLVRIQDMFIQSGLSYLVMDVVRGRSLRHLVADPQASIDQSNAVAWSAQICDALALVHSQSTPLVFGDLNPGHVLITADGEVKLVDFGLSSWFMPWLRGTPRFQGSPGYAAPEQRERWEADPRSDLYALGGLLYYLLTRQAPNQPPLRLNELSPALAQIVRRARQRNPEQRFASAAEMRQALGKGVAGAPVKPSAEAEPARPAARPAKPTPAAMPTAPKPATNTWADMRLQLAEHAASDWLRAVRRFFGGQTVEGLRREASRMEKEGALEMAMQTQRAIAEAEVLMAQGEMEDALGRQMAVARWMVAIGAVAAEPRFEIEPHRLAFGGLTRKIAKRTSLRIRNTGVGPLVGEVESRLPWLEVPEGRFACPSGAEVSVSVIASGRKLPVEGERSARALRVITNRGDAWAAATATLIVPALVVAPEILDFGQVPHDQVAQAELVIANQGGGEITGAIKSAVAWLSVTPAQFRIGAEGKQVVRVRFHGDVAPAEASEVANVLSIDSDLGQVRVAARWRWAEPGLLIAPNALDWGERTRDATAALALTITNTGTAALEGKIVARGAWLSAKPSAFTCAPGQALTASVRANLNDLPPGRTALNEALVIESNAGRWSVPAAVFVLAPEMQIRPLALDLGEIEWGDVSSAILRLANHGTAPLTAQITSLFPWLHAEVDEITCPPGESVRVTVEARSEEMLRGGQWPGLPGLRIESDAGTHEVDITLLVYKPELQVTPEYLDFGVIPRQGVGQVTLTISNPGTASLGWALSSDALWLELTADQGVTMPGETSQVNLYAYGLALPEEDATVLLTIESDAGEIALRGAISIARPQLWVAPPLLIDLGVSVNRAAVEDVLSLFNRGVGDLTGTVRATVPWLSAAPSEFRIGTGGQQPITVRALPEGLREGETLIEGALEIVSDAGSEVVDVRLEVELSGQLVIETPQLAWALGETPPLLLLRNAGQAPLAVVVRPQAKWLWVNHERLAIKPGRTAKVEVNVDMAALPATSPVATEIILDEGGRIHRIAVAIARGA